MSEKLAGTTAIITGAAAGISAATAMRFAREGAAVVVADKDGTGAERISGEIIAKGGRAIAGVILFLVSDDASYVNGQTLAVDGGFTAAGLRVKQV